MPVISNFATALTGEPTKLKVSFKITWAPDDAGRSFAVSIFFTERDGARDDVGLLSAYYPSSTASVGNNLTPRLILDRIKGDADDLSVNKALLANVAPFASDPDVVTGAAGGIVALTYYVSWPTTAIAPELAAEEIEKWDVHAFVTPAGKAATARSVAEGLIHDVG